MTALDQILKKYHRLWAMFLILSLTLLYTFIIMNSGSDLVGFDESLQLSTIQHALAGKSFSVPYIYDASDLSNVTYDYVLTWPPAYAFFNAIVYLITSDIAWALIIVEVVAMLILFSSMYAILGIIIPHAPILWRSSPLIIWFFVQAPLYRSTNVMATASWYLAVYLLLRLLPSLNINVNMRFMLMSFFIGLIVGIGAALRYAFIPYLAVMPVMLFGLMIIYRLWQLWIPIILVTFGSGLVLSSVMLLNYSQSGFFLRQIGDELSSGTLDFTNLASFTPFGATVLDAQRGWNFIGDTLQLPASLILTLIWIVSIVIVMGVMWMSFRLIYPTLRQRHTPENIPYMVFTSTGILGFGATVTYLSYLTITSVPVLISGELWYAVSELRYFAIIMIWLLIIWIIELWTRWQHRADYHLTNWQKVASVTFGIIIIVGFLGAILMQGALIRNRLQNFEPFQGEATIATHNLFYDITSTTVDTHGDTIAIVGTIFNQDVARHYVLLASATWYGGDLMDIANIATTQPLTVLVGIPIDRPVDNPERKMLESVVMQHNAELIYEFEDYIAIYQFQMTPNR